MSMASFTTFNGKFMSFFFSSNFRNIFDWFINWPERISYTAWQSLLKSYLWFIGTNNHVRLYKTKKRRRTSRRYRKILRAKTRLEDEMVQRSYKCEWLFSWRLSAKTCELATYQARLRWEIEDLFNVMKNVVLI